MQTLYTNRRMSLSEKLVASVKTPAVQAAFLTGLIVGICYQIALHFYATPAQREVWAWAETAVGVALNLFIARTTMRRLCRRHAYSYGWPMYETLLVASFCGSAIPVASYEIWFHIIRAGMAV